MTGIAIGTAAGSARGLPRQTASCVNVAKILHQGGATKCYCCKHIETDLHTNHLVQGIGPNWCRISSINSRAVTSEPVDSEQQKVHPKD